MSVSIKRHAKCMSELTTCPQSYHVCSLLTHMPAQRRPGENKHITVGFHVVRLAMCGTEGLTKCISKLQLEVCRPVEFDYVPSRVLIRKTCHGHDDATQPVQRYNCSRPGNETKTYFADVLKEKIHIIHINWNLHHTKMHKITIFND